MPKSVFEYNGRNCRDFNCYKTQPINFPTPAKDFDLIEVPGRNGDIILDNGHYKNVEIVIECFIDGDFLTYYDAFRAFLMADHDYHKLVDSLYPDEYRLACVRNVEAKIKTPKRGTVEITMSCQPQRFLKSGELEIELNYTEDLIAVGGTAWDVYGDLDASAQAQITALGLNTGYGFSAFNLPRDTDYVVLKTPSKPDGWIFPNDNIVYGDGYSFSQSHLNTGYTYHAAPEVSPFLSVWDDTEEIFSPAYYPTIIHNPTNYPATPIIKIYFDGTENPAQWNLDTSFGIDADNFVTYDYFWDDGNTIRSKPIVTIDCDTYDAYADEVTGIRRINHNSGVKFEGKLTIPPGTSVFRISDFRAGFGGVTKITLIPRWWTI